MQCPPFGVPALNIQDVSFPMGRIDSGISTHTRTRTHTRARIYIYIYIAGVTNRAMFGVNLGSGTMGTIKNLSAYTTTNTTIRGERSIESDGGLFHVDTVDSDGYNYGEIYFHPSTYTKTQTYIVFRSMYMRQFTYVGNMRIHMYISMYRYLQVLRVLPSPSFAMRIIPNKRFHVAFVRSILIKGPLIGRATASTIMKHDRRIRCKPRKRTVPLTLYTLHDQRFHTESNLSNVDVDRLLDKVESTRT